MQEQNKKPTLYNQTEELPAILTARHVSLFLGLNKTGTYALFKRQGFPSVFIGNKRIVLRDALLRWLENEAAKPIKQKIAQ